MKSRLKFHPSALVNKFQWHIRSRPIGLRSEFISFLQGRRLQQQQQQQQQLQQRQQRQQQQPSTPPSTYNTQTSGCNTRVYSGIMTTNHVVAIFIGECYPKSTKAQIRFNSRYWLHCHSNWRVSRTKISPKITRLMSIPHYIFNFCPRNP